MSSWFHFFFVFFLFLFLQLDNFLLFYACVLFFIFVNLLLYFDLWLPCFSSLLTPSYICLLWWSYRLKNILKNKKNLYFLTTPILYFWCPLLHLHVYHFIFPCVCHLSQIDYFLFVLYPHLYKWFAFLLWFSLSCIFLLSFLFRGDLSIHFLGSV